MTEQPRGAPQSAAALEAVSVVKSWDGRRRALDGVSLRVFPGETVALVGESGSGKTTLLRCFNLLVRPDSGEVLFRGGPAGDVHALRRATGYVEQQSGLLPHWTVERNVGLVPELLGWDPARRAARTAELLRTVGLDPGEFAARHPVELSGGQRQRVAFARALAADPAVVLLDEPFGALDAITRAELRAEFRRLQARLAKTVLLVTHDLGEAFELADRVAVLLQGRILQDAPPEELRRRPAHPYVEKLLAANAP